MHRLVQQVGVGVARRLVLLPDELGADRLLQAGVLDQVVDDLDTAVIALQGRVAGSEPAIRRRLLLDAATVAFEEALGAHLAACDRALRVTAAR